MDLSWLPQEMMKQKTAEYHNKNENYERAQNQENDCGVSLCVCDVWCVVCACNEPDAMNRKQRDKIQIEKGK